MKILQHHWLRSLPGIAVVGLALSLAASAQIPYYVDAGRPDDSGDGLTWGTAKQTIQAAIDLTLDGDTVWIADGIYPITAQITIDKGITVRSVNGPETVIVQRDSGTIRVVSIAHADAVVEGLTLRNGTGQAGAGVHMTGGLLRDCIVRDNSAGTGQFGAGIYIGGGGVVSNCVVRNNSSSLGGGAGVYVSDGLLYGSTIVSNTTFSGGNDGGGGVYADGSDALVANCVIAYNRETRDGAGAGARIQGSALMRNCLIVSNTLDSTYTPPNVGGGVYIAGAGSLIENCTIVGNAVSDDNAGGGVYMADGTVRNSIVYFNVSPGAAANYRIVAGNGFFNSCTTPLPAIGSQNTDRNPLFVNRAAGDYRVQPGPARNTGAVQAWMGTATDLDGHPRLDTGDRVNMGAYQDQTAALRCAAGTRDFPAGPVSFPVTMDAYVEGSHTNGLTYRWDFRNTGQWDLQGSEHASPRYTFTEPGVYDVKLEVENSRGETAVFTNVNLITATMTNIYVSAGGSGVAPYTNPATAATRIFDAVNLAGAGARVLVDSGTYALDRSLVVDRAFAIVGINGADNTVLQRTGAGMYRVMHVNHAQAVVQGVTTLAGNAGAAGGSGIYVSDGLVRDCVVRNNITVAAWGSALYIAGGTVRDSVIRNNALSAAGTTAAVEIRGGVLERSSVVSNSVSGGTFSAAGIKAVGAGVLIDRCRIAHNTLTREGDGAGVRLESGAQLRNSAVTSNIVNGGRHGGGVYMAGASSLIENCTLVANTVIANQGGGIYSVDGSVRNSIVYGNTAPSHPETDNYRWVGGTFTYSCTTPLPAGVGNIDDDPLFADAAAGDYRLQKRPIRSPGIDAGTNQVWMIGATDLDGNPRLRRGRIHEALPAIVDMGAFEYHAPEKGVVMMLR